MSSSDDDVPLGQMKGGLKKSAPTVPKHLDRKLDKAYPSTNSSRPGISIRNGPVEKMDVDSKKKAAVTNGKRKSRSSGVTYAEASDSESEPKTKKRRKSAGKPIIDSDSDSDVPLSSVKANGVGKAGKKPPANKDILSDSSDSDTPLNTKLAKQKASIQKKAEMEAKKKQKTPTSSKKKVVDSDDDEPLAKKKRLSNGTPAKKSKPVKKEESDSDVPIARRASKKGKPAPKSASATPVKKSKAKKEEDDSNEEDGVYRWWEDPGHNDDTTKWNTLEHNGVVFPPPYEPLPKNVKLIYDGKPVNLAPEAEEVAGFFGSMLNSTQNVENPVFQKNFFGDFQDTLKKTGGAKDRDGNKVAIRDFSKCDFKQIFQYYDAEREKKRALPAAEKKALKAKKDAEEAPYQFCTWDGRKQKVGNFRVEPPALFRGRGEHPKTGKVKQRVLPEQVTINIGKEAKIPSPPPGHKWKEVKHDKEGTWLAMWQENINGNYKYVMLAANSAIKGQSDYKKFEKARELKKHISRIRADYNKQLKSDKMADRQLATAMYLIDQFALRAGNEKTEDEADTVGCCSLKFEHVSLKPPNTVIFDFLGKDSIPYYDEVEVAPQVFKNLKIFKKPPKEAEDKIFDRLSTTILNKHLSSYMDGLTAKVFRTYNASFTMAKLLKELKAAGNDAEKIKAYNDANRRVAILCNHKRTVTAGHAGQMEKMSERIKGIKYQKWRTKKMILDVEPTQKKKLGAAYFELDDELDQEWIKEHQQSLVQEERQKIEKKFNKKNEQLAAEGQKEMKAKELNENLKVADELAAKFKKENKSGKVLAEGKGMTVEKLKEKIKKLDERVQNLELQAEDKENNKEVALGTSKINYIDPRLTVVFSQKFNVPIEKFFSKTLREKFDWAIQSVDEDWEF